MKKIIFISVLFFSLISFGQTPMHKVVFYDSIKKETFSKLYSFKKVIKEYNLEKTSYEVEYFSRENNVEVLNYRCYVNDKVELTRNGECTYFYDSGAKKEIENYENGKLSGITKRWNKNGKLYFEGEYKLHNDKPTLFCQNYWDKSGNQKLKDGNGIFEEFIGENEEVIFSGEIKDGLKDGIWKTNNNSYPRKEEVFKDGQLLLGSIHKSETIIRNYHSEGIFASPVCGMQEFRIRLAKKIINSKLTLDFKGKIQFRFVVNEDGELVDFSRIEGMREDLYNKLIDIIKNTSKWESGIYNGREVKQYFTLPIVLQ